MRPLVRPIIRMLDFSVDENVYANMSMTDRQDEIRRYTEAIVKQYGYEGKLRVNARTNAGSAQRRPVQKYLEGAQFTYNLYDMNKIDNVQKLKDECYKMTENAINKSRTEKWLD